MNYITDYPDNKGEDGAPTRVGFLYKAGLQSTYTKQGTLMQCRLFRIGHQAIQGRAFRVGHPAIWSKTFRVGQPATQSRGFAVGQPALQSRGF